MEELSVKEVVRENKKNAKAFSVFLDERIINDDIGPRLDQFLANARERGLYPLLGEDHYAPLQEGVIVVCPRSWGVTTPNELIGALVCATVIGTIPVAEDLPEHGEILVVQLTEPDEGEGPADFVRAGDGGRFETDLKLGWDVWIDYPPGIPTAFPAEEPDPDPAPDDDDEGYW